MKESGAISSEICHSTIHENLLQEPRERDITGEQTRYKTNTKDIESRSKTQYNFSLNVRRRVIFIWIKRKKNWCRVWNKPLGFIIQKFSYCNSGLGYRELDQVNFQTDRTLPSSNSGMPLSSFFPHRNIQRSSLHLSDSRVSPRGVMSKDHSSRTLPYFPSGDLSEEKKKRLSWRLKMAFCLRGKQREGNEWERGKGREQNGATFYLVHSVSHKSFTVSS